MGGSGPCGQGEGGSKTGFFLDVINCGCPLLASSAMWVILFSATAVAFWAF